MFSNLAGTASSQQLISYLSHVGKRRSKSLRIKLPYILNKHLLFLHCKLTCVRVDNALRSWFGALPSKGGFRHVIDSSSASLAQVRVRFHSFDSKVNPLSTRKQFKINLLRHC